ncbi:4-hydroxyphenylacetate 3-monooxygenase reductase component [Pseudomonas sp. Bi70]|uniref:flavin reductase n=1 Tax=Pseudomonas sp. Bi70 TaxID=2821127 RepID=UPI001D51151E|nr:flavin reductase [Pseudomonas sp. Bi70]CAH0144504.1 4-hydroxyphenylacetate 3-monooxygenase reductase component [Pseudomonas sp. Bi70]
MASNQSRQDFRQALSLLSAAVNVITTDGPHGRLGLTASAVCSVTDTPPTLLVCINRNSSIHGALLGNRALCVNILTGHLEGVARQFAGMTDLPPAERFSSQDWRTGSSGLPVLNDALASLEGTIVDVKEVGSHSVLFVEINEIQVREDGESLIYFGRNFHRLGRTATVELQPSAS